LAVVGRKGEQPEQPKQPEHLGTADHKVTCSNWPLIRLSYPPSSHRSCTSTIFW